jgi:TRAP-type uncharacterized transport system substrate-binding protein
MKSIKKLSALAVAAGLAASLSGHAQAQDFYKLATLGPGSSPYLVMSTFAQLVGQKLPGVPIQVNATGAAPQHMIEPTTDQRDFFITATTVFEAFESQTAR